MSYEQISSRKHSCNAINDKDNLDHHHNKDDDDDGGGDCGDDDDDDDDGDDHDNVDGYRVIGAMTTMIMMMGIVLLNT